MKENLWRIPYNMTSENPKWLYVKLEKDYRRIDPNLINILTDNGVIELTCREAESLAETLYILIRQAENR